MALFGKGSSKGASAAENQIGSDQYDFMKTLQKDFGTAFAGQQNILNGIAKAGQSVLAGGPSQFGFSAPETTALNTLATSANARGYQNARAAIGAAGGGGANLPSGANSAAEASLAEKAAEQQSNSLLGIQEAGYKAGRENYYDAEGNLLKAASIENPAGIGSEANTAGAHAFSSADEIQKQNAAASPWAQVGGLVGSLGGAALNLVAPGAGTALGALGGLASKVGQSNQNFQNSYQFQSSNPGGTIPDVPYQSLDSSLFSSPYQAG